MLNLLEADEQRRTVEEFCSTQEDVGIKGDVSCATINVHPEELLSEQVFILFNFFFQNLIVKYEFSFYGLNLLDFQQ